MNPLFFHSAQWAGRFAKTGGGGASFGERPGVSQAFPSGSKPGASCVSAHDALLPCMGVLRLAGVAVSMGGEGNRGGCDAFPWVFRTVSTKAAGFVHRVFRMGWLHGLRAGGGTAAPAKVNVAWVGPADARRDSVPSVGGCVPPSRRLPPQPRADPWEGDPGFAQVFHSLSTGMRANIHEFSHSRGTAWGRLESIRYKWMSFPVPGGGRRATRYGTYAENPYEGRESVISATERARVAAHASVTRECMGNPSANRLFKVFPSVFLGFSTQCACTIHRVFHAAAHCPSPLHLL